MTQLTPEQIQNASETELRARAAEMRSELPGVSESRMKGDDAAWHGFVNEIETIDRALDLIGLQAQRTRSVPGAATADVSSAAEVRSAGHIITEDEGFRNWLSQNASSAHLYGASPTIEVRTLVTNSSTDATASGLLLPVNQPYLVGINRQRLFIRDLLDVQATGLSAIHYVRAGNTSTTTSASTVAEGATKPESGVTFTPDIAPVTVIAANIPITTQVLEDSTTVVSYINGQLVYELKLTEEKEILNGNGVSPDLKGILQYAVQTQAVVTSAVQTVAAAIAKIEVANGYADGLAMNPADFWTMVSARASTSGVMDAGTPFSQAPLNVWGLTAVRTNGLALHKALVGCFSLGATLWDRQQANVRIYEQHSDYAVKNKVLLQAEERVALSVNRADWFVDTTIS